MEFYHSWQESAPLNSTPFLSRIFQAWNMGLSSWFGWRAHSGSVVMTQAVLLGRPGKTRGVGNRSSL